MAKRASYHWLYLLSNLLVFGVIWYGVRNSSTAAAAKQVPYGELLTDVRAGDVSDVRIGQTNLLGTLKPDAAKAVVSQP